MITSLLLYFDRLQKGAVVPSALLASNVLRSGFRRRVGEIGALRGRSSAVRRERFRHIVLRARNTVSADWLMGHDIAWTLGQ